MPMRHVLSVTLALLLLPAVAHATDGDILGVVADKTGGVLPGVTLTAVNTDTGFSRVTVSDADGRYRFV
jgi:hypothetical protein